MNSCRPAQSLIGKSTLTKQSGLARRRGQKDGMVPVTFTVFIRNGPGLIVVWTNQCWNLRHRLLRRHQLQRLQLLFSWANTQPLNIGDPGRPGGSSEIFINSSKHPAPGILPLLTFCSGGRQAFIPTSDIRVAKCYRSLKAYFSPIPCRHLICWSNFSSWSCLSNSIICHVLPVELQSSVSWSCVCAFAMSFELTSPTDEREELCARENRIE